MVCYNGHGYAIMVRSLQQKDDLIVVSYMYVGKDVHMRIL